jgi:hypothetical protein
MGGACSTYLGELRHIQGFEGNPDVDGRIILRWIFRKWDLGVWTGSIL